MEFPSAPSPSERRWVWIFAILVMVLISLPYLISSIRQGEDWSFTGFLFGVSDGNSYIGKMLLGSWGEWLFRTPYTAYPQDGLFLFFPYILLGKLARPPFVHDHLVVLYHIYRLAAGLLMIHATYDFISLFLVDPRWRRFATVLAVLGGGFGWITIFGLSHIFAWGLPLESYSPEGFGFLSIYGLPHLAIARALLLWGLRDFLVHPDWFRHPRGWICTGLTWAAIGFFQPIIQAVGMFVVAFFLLFTGLVQVIRWRTQGAPDWRRWFEHIFSGMSIAVCAAPLTAYTFLSFRLNPTLQAWEQQSIIGSPPPLEYLIGYGVALPLALMGLRPLLRKLPWHGWLLAGWLVFVPIAAYGPFPSQRRFLDGFWVVLSILAVYLISIISPKQRKLALGWITLAFPMTLFILTAGFLFSANPSKPLFRPAEEVAVFEYLAQNAQPWDVVLASDDTANPLPAWAPVRALNGHGPESLNGAALRERIACFYSSACAETERMALIQEFGIDYVIWGPSERELGDWDPNQWVELQEVFASGAYQVFRTPESY